MRVDQAAGLAADQIDLACLISNANICLVSHSEVSVSQSVRLTSRLVHLDVEDQVRGFAPKALLCHKEPVKACKIGGYFGSLRHKRAGEKYPENISTL